MTETIYRVSSSTNVKSLGSSIAKALLADKGKTVLLNCIGASSVNQACKAIATANIFVASSLESLSIKIAYGEVTIADEEKTMLVFHVKLDNK